MNRFNFDKYEFDAESKTARFYYSYEGGPAFVESYKFDFEFVDFNPEALDRALQTLFLIAGVSYYKAYLPAEISVSGAQIDQKTADFMTKTYQKGLGELFFVNSLPPERKIDFPVNSQGTAENIVESNGLLVGIGGGKDSLVGLELLADAP
ncbi:MAG TPA: hypothetical protein VFK11_02685, partial [Candidatus Saccharimonadales bacterium]|nr:hypothetical protein [Candidatus Saccharimonadales bacterium]